MTTLHRVSVDHLCLLALLENLQELACYCESLRPRLPTRFLVRSDQIVVLVDPVVANQSLPFDYCQI